MAFHRSWNLMIGWSRSLVLQVGLELLQSFTREWTVTAGCSGYWD